MEELELSRLRLGNVANIFAGKDTLPSMYEFHVVEEGIWPVCDMYEWPFIRESDRRLSSIVVGPVRVMLLGCGEDETLQELSLNQQQARVDEREASDVRPSANGVLRASRTMVVVPVGEQAIPGQQVWREVLPLVDQIVVRETAANPVVNPSWSTRGRVTA